VYLDDVIAFYWNVGDRIRHLHEVPFLLERACVSLKPCKGQLFQQEGKNLGHVVLPGQLLVN